MLHHLARTVSAEREPHGQKKKITAKPRPYPKQTHTETQDSLLGFGTVGVIYHHAPSKASPHGLGCNELQLQNKAHTEVIHQQCPRDLSSTTANCTGQRWLIPAPVELCTRLLVLHLDTIWTPVHCLPLVLPASQSTLVQSVQQTL